jgi:hypothetical protein
MTKKRESFDSLSLLLGFLTFDVWFDDVEIIQDVGDVINPIESVKITQFDIVIGLKDCLSGCSIIQVVSVDSAFDVVVYFGVIFFAQSNRSISGDIEEDCVVWVLL